MKLPPTALDQAVNPCLQTPSFLKPVWLKTYWWVSPQRAKEATEKKLGYIELKKYIYIIFLENTCRRFKI